MQYKITLFVFLLFCSASTAHSQMLAQQQVLTLEGAKAIVAAAEVEAATNNWEVVIAIVDAGGHLLFLERMDGVQIGSVEVARQKAVSAALFRRPTKAFADRLNDGATAMLDVPNAITLEGGLPIVVDGKVIGGIGVSGVRADQDAQIARAGLAVLE